MAEKENLILVQLKTTCPCRLNGYCEKDDCDGWEYHDLNLADVLARVSVPQGDDLYSYPLADCTIDLY